MNDLIIRKAAIEYFQRIIDATNTDGRYNLGFIDGLEFCINHLSTMPSAQPEQTPLPDKASEETDNKDKLKLVEEKLDQLEEKIRQLEKDIQRLQLGFPICWT